MFRHGYGVQGCMWSERRRFGRPSAPRSSAARRCSGSWPESGALRAGGSGPLSAARSRHRPRRGSDTLVRSHPPDRRTASRGGTRPVSQAADGLDRTRSWRDLRGGWRWTMPISAVRSGERGRGAAGKTPFVAAVSTSPEGRPAEAGAGQGLPQARDRARRQARWPPERLTDGLCWGASTKPPAIGESATDALKSGVKLGTMPDAISTAHEEI